jgi:hypothetical protein
VFLAVPQSGPDCFPDPRLGCTSTLVFATNCRSSPLTTPFLVLTIPPACRPSHQDPAALLAGVPAPRPARAHPSRRSARTLLCRCILLIHHPHGSSNCTLITLDVCSHGCKRDVLARQPEFSPAFAGAGHTKRHNPHLQRWWCCWGRQHPCTRNLASASRTNSFGTTT